MVTDARVRVPVTLKPSSLPVACIFPARCTALMRRFQMPQFFCPRFGPTEYAAPSDVLKIPRNGPGGAHRGAVRVQLLEEPHDPTSHCSVPSLRQ